jgi:hypothetical protein
MLALPDDLAALIGSSMNSVMIPASGQPRPLRFRAADARCLRR